MISLDHYEGHRTVSNSARHIVAVVPQSGVCCASRRELKSRKLFVQHGTSHGVVRLCFWIFGIDPTSHQTTSSKDAEMSL